MRKCGCQSRSHVDCAVETELWECAKCHRKFCYADGGADEFPDYCDDCWYSAIHLREGFEEQSVSDPFETKTWNEFPIIARDSAYNFSTGTAELVVVNGEGYLCLVDSEGILLGWINGKQFSAIVKKWLHLRSVHGKKLESERFHRIRKWQARQLKQIAKESRV